jgi:glycosyltransferase involved in cell wall biosynthesis
MPAFFPTKKTIHLWCPNIGERGGIQVFSAFLLRALKEIYPDADCAVILKHDTVETVAALQYSDTEFHTSGSWPNAFRTTAFAGKLFTMGAVHRPDLIITTHLHFTPAAYWLKRMAGVPYWAIAHGVEAWGVKKPTLRSGIADADRIMSVSTYTRDRLIAEQGLHAGRIAILPNTFDPARFIPRPKPEYLLDRYALTRSQPVILTLSRLVASEQYKGYDKILLALPAIKRAVPGVKYIVAGKGDDRERIERLVQKANLQDTVIITGFVPDSELCDHYNLCDVFAMPSKREGFGIVYLEAMACGKPTVGGSKDGAVDALRGGDLGVLVDPDDTQQIEATLIGILKRELSHPIMYFPHLLRKQVIEAYGFERFSGILSMYLEEFFIAQAA